MSYALLISDTVRVQLYLFHKFLELMFKMIWKKTTELLLLYIFALTRKNFVNKHKTIRHLPIVHTLLFKSLIDSTKNKAREQSPLYLKFRNSLNTLLL